MDKPQTLKGFRDFLPQNERKRQHVISILKNVFESFGFEPLETPALEYEELLLGKYGQEGEQLMYRFEDNGKRRVALRYDQTVPLSRVITQYQDILPNPFKRYQIQPVWRAENTQQGRYREFLQCDCDIVGINSSYADAEIIQCAARGLEALGFNKFSIIINDRRVFSELIEKGIVSKDEMEQTVIAVDKLKKIGDEGVIVELTKKGILKQRAEELLNIIKTQEKTDTLKDIDLYLTYFPDLSQKCVFDPTLARGLNYYTGIIFEIEIDGYPVGSVCGGGRYDNLIGALGGKDVPAVGFAYGFDRVIEAMETLSLFPTTLQNSSTKVLVTVFSEELRQTSLEVVTQLREKNISSEIYLGPLKEKNQLEKQLKYADQKTIPYIIIIGPDEKEKNTAVLKDMKTREQRTLSVTELVQLLEETR